MIVKAAKTNTDLKAAIFVRGQVFVNEFGMNKDEVFDDLDDKSLILVGFEGLTPVATCRVLVKNDTSYISKLCVMPNKRNQGLGSMMLKSAEKRTLDEFDFVKRFQVAPILDSIIFLEKNGYSFEFGNVELGANMQKKVI